MHPRYLRVFLNNFTNVTLPWILAQDFSSLICHSSSFWLLNPTFSQILKNFCEIVYLELLGTLDLGSQSSFSFSCNVGVLLLQVHLAKWPWGLFHCLSFGTNCTITDINKVNVLPFFILIFHLQPRRFISDNNSNSSLFWCLSVREVLQTPHWIHSFVLTPFKH